MLHFQIKERLDFILLCLLLIRHQVLSKSTSDDIPSHSLIDDEVTWNGWPDTEGVSEIKALVDYATGLVFYKDTSVPACFVEDNHHPSHSLRYTPSNLPKVLSVSSKLHKISNSDEWANSLYKEQFCGSLPIFKIQTVDEKKLKRLPRKKRHASGGSASGSQAQASQWPSSSQTQVQGSVSGQGFFSGQAQAAHGGYSQSQVQLGGQGITGNLQSSAGNAQSQLSLGEHGGAGQASSFGLGPSSSQVQVNLGQREQGSHASANVYQQHDQGDYSKLRGNGYGGGGGRQSNGHKISTYPAYGNGQSQVPPQDYQQQGGSTFSGQPQGSHGRNGYVYPASNGQRLPGYSQPQYSQPQPQQHTSYSNGRSSAQQPKLPGYDSQSNGHGQSLQSGGPIHGQPQATGYDQTIPLSGTHGINGQHGGGFGQTIPPIQVQPPQTLPGSGYTQTLPSGTQQFPSSGSGIGTNGRGGQSLTPGTGLQGLNGQQAPQQTFYTQQTPGTTSLGTQDHTATGHRSYDSYPSSSGRDTGTGRQSQNQGIYIDSNVQPLNGHGVGQQSTQNGDHRRRHGNGAHVRGGTYGASAGAGTGYGAYATAPGGQAQAQSMHIGSFGSGTNGQHDYSGGYRKTPYYSTAPQSSQIPKLPASTSQDGSHGGTGYTNGYRTPGQVVQQPAQNGQTSTLHGTDGYRSSGDVTSGGTGHHIQDQDQLGHGNGHHVVDQRQPSQTNGIIDQEHHTRQNGNGHHGITQQQPVRTNGNGHHGITQQQPVRTNGNGHHGTTQQQPVRTNGNGHHGTTQQQPVRTNGNGHHGITQQQPVRNNGNGHHGITQQQPAQTNGNGHHGVTQLQPTRSNGNGHHGITQQQPVRTNGNGHHGITQQQPARTNGNGQSYGTTSTTYSNGNGKVGNGYRNGHSISVNGYSSGNGHRTTNGYVPQHQQPQYSQRQSGTNGHGVTYGAGSSSPGKSQPQCQVITFTCTIVIESNGRAKLCKPKSTSTNGNGGGNTGATANTDQTVCCC